MSNDHSTDRERGFATIVARHALLPDDATQELTRDAANSGVPPEKLAVERGLLDAVQADLVQMLERPRDAVPGYELIDVLGRGGMGIVFRARQVNLDRIVALKTVLMSQVGKPAALARFEQEARTAGQLQHPHLAAAYDFGRHEGRLFLAMELIPGEDLATRLEREGRHDERLTWQLIRQAASGLASAAQAGIVHRDIKPANLLLSPPPEGFPLPAGVPLLKVVDFGLALLTGERQIDDRLTDSGTLGSPRYMAPEQIESSDVDQRADIYSLGATAYHLLSGQAPFAGDTLAGVLAKKLTAGPQPLASVSPPVSAASIALVEAMMSRQPASRVPNHRELLARIDAWLASDDHAAATAAAPAVWPTAAPQTPASATIVAPVEPRQSSINRRTVTWGLLLGLGIAALIAWSMMLRGRGKNDPSLQSSLQPSGAGTALFDGRSLRGWLPAQGAWQVGADSEGGRVLVGQGLIRRPWNQPEWPTFRWRLGVCLHQASSASLGLEGFPDGRRLQLRLVPDAIELVRVDPQGQVVETIERRARPPELADDGPIYHELQADWDDGRWWIGFDGRTLASVQGASPTRPTELWLEATAGEAWFDAIEGIELVPKD